MISRNYEIPAARILSLKLTVGSVNTMLIAIPSELYPVGRWKPETRVGKQYFSLQIDF